MHVEPFFAFTIADEYSRSLIVGAELRFHFLDWLGIGGWGGYVGYRAATEPGFLGDIGLTDDGLGPAFRDASIRSYAKTNRARQGTRSQAPEGGRPMPDRGQTFSSRCCRTARKAPRGGSRSR